MKAVRLGIIGCGIATNELHWPALASLRDQFEITCVCNHTRPKAEQFAAKVGGVDYVLDYRELLARTDVEAVDIVLPIHLNHQVVRDALAAGKHVIVEKPLAANLTQARELCDLETASDRVTMVAENYRYRPIYRKLKAILDDGEIGEPFAAVWNVAYQVTPENNKYAATRWRQQHQYPGGFITDGGVHNIAVFRLLFGEITGGAAMTGSVNPVIGEVDTFLLQFRTERGVLGNFQVFYSAVGHRENRLIVFGKQGSVEWQDQTLTIRSEDSAREVVVKDDGGYQEQFRDFYAAIREGRKPVSTFAEGMKDLQVILTALKAAEERKVFSIP